MTPEEKAEELIDKALEIYNDPYYFHEKLAKLYAIMCVDETLWALNDIDLEVNVSDYIPWWQEVKRILENDY